MSLRAPHHALSPPIHDDALGGFRSGAVVAIEGTGGHVQKELRAIIVGLRLESVKDLLGQASGIVGCLDHDRRHRTDEYCFGNTTFPVPSDITSHLAAAGRVTHMDCILEVKVSRQGREVIRVVIHIMTGCHLRRATMAASIMCDYSKAASEEERHLSIPVVGSQRPAMRKDNRLTGTPVLVENGDAVFRLDSVHWLISSVWVAWDRSVRGWLAGCGRDARHRGDRTDSRDSLQKHTTRCQMPH